MRRADVERIEWGNIVSRGCAARIFPCGSRVPLFPRPTVILPSMIERYRGITSISNSDAVLACLARVDGDSCQLREAAVIDAYIGETRFSLSFSLSL